VTPPAIRLDEVSHRYPDGRLALDRVSLDVAPGEALAIRGPTGSGKSTLIRHLNGLLRPTTGRVLLDGEDVRSWRVAELARRVGVAFQEPDRQLFRPTVWQEVTFGAAIPDEAAAALEALGLEHLRHRHPLDLGYSRRKLVAIASVLAMATPVVVLDEPTTGQDRHGLELLVKVAARLRAEGRTLIVVSHNEEFVKRACRRWVRLEGGRLV
jgi:energy-coupling factor transporter ATP-binding protein EcfA2